jgi:hypothetical protein
MRITRLLMIVFLLVLLAGSDAVGQMYEHGNIEFSMLGGVTIFMPEYGDNSTIIALPQGSAGAWMGVFPGFRMSVWTDSPLLFDFGCSIFSVSEEGDDISLLNLEGGVGAAFEMENSNVSPFVQGIIGFMSISNGDSESELYLGGQGGIRYFFRETSAARFQVGYRHMMGDELDFDTVEIAGGISFFL